MDYKGLTELRHRAVNAIQKKEEKVLRFWPEFLGSRVAVYGWVARYRQGDWNMLDAPKTSAADLGGLMGAFGSGADPYLRVPYQKVEDNLEVKEMLFDDRRYIVCRNPQEVRKDEAARDPNSRTLSHTGVAV